MGYDNGVDKCFLPWDMDYGSSERRRGENKLILSLIEDQYLKAGHEKSMDEKFTAIA